MGWPNITNYGEIYLKNRAIDYSIIITGIYQAVSRVNIEICGKPRDKAIL